MILEAIKDPVLIISLYFYRRIIINVKWPLRSKVILIHQVCLIKVVEYV